MTATTKSQVLVNAKINGTTRDNRRTFQSDNRLYWTSQKTYGLGTDTAEDAAVDQKYDYFRFFETMYWRVARNTYLGAGFLYSNHRNVRPADEEAEAAWAASPYVTYSEQNGFDLESQTSAGVSLNAARRQPRRRHQPQPGLVREALVRARSSRASSAAPRTGR